jgi:probable addiction module antidote protein
MTRFKRFDASAYLTTETAATEFLNAALEDENPQVFIAALGAVAKARGMTEVAKAAGLGRESLYKSLRQGSKLRYETVRKLMHALGLKLSAVPAE